MLELIVFICGAVVMVLELVGSRVLAPYLGTSIVVWTSLIGIILGSLSLGYWWGGRLADRTPSYKKLSLIIFAAAIYVATVTFAKTPVLEVLSRHINNFHVSAVIATIILFAPTSVLLGMISPYAVRLKIRDLNSFGSTVGNLYAISTVGSIAGTFLAGFILIAYFGTTKILLVLAIVLTFTSALAYAKSGLAAKGAAAGLLIVFLVLIGSYERFQEKRGIIDVDTQYNRILIQDTEDWRTKRPTRVMVTNPKEVQSAMFLDGDDDLVLHYTRYYRLARHFRPDLRSALMIGGAGYSYPKEFLRRFPNAQLDVVEIDPRVTELAKTYFGLKEDPRLGIYHEDGRTFLNKTLKRYDVIFGDAYRAFYSLPYHLTTLEAAQRIYNILTERGVVMINMISAFEGEKGMFLRAEYATFRAVFSQVYLFAIRDPGDRLEVQNIMLVALKSAMKSSFTNDNPELDRYLKNRWIRDVAADLPVLTDDYAPVDNYILKALEDI